VLTLQTALWQLQFATKSAKLK